MASSSTGAAMSGSRVISGGPGSVSSEIAAATTSDSSGVSFNFTVAPSVPTPGAVRFSDPHSAENRGRENGLERSTRTGASDSGELSTSQDASAVQSNASGWSPAGVGVVVGEGPTAATLISVGATGTGLGES